MPEVAKEQFSDSNNWATKTLGTAAILGFGLCATMIVSPFVAFAGFLAGSDDTIHKLLCIDSAMIQGVEAPSWQGRPSA